MLGTDKDAFICDMAETYHIYDYKAVPVQLLSTLANGLRDSSRIKCKMSEMPIALETFLLSAIYDKVSWLQWAKTKDAEKGRNMPESITAKLMNTKQESQIESFENGEEFMKAWHKLTGEKDG